MRKFRKYSKLSEQDVEERITALEEAQILIVEAVDAIRFGVSDTSSEMAAESYIIGHLLSWAEGETESNSIPNLIKELENYNPEDYY